jgi:hypothetical protein
MTKKLPAIEITFRNFLQHYFAYIFYLRKKSYSPLGSGDTEVGRRILPPPLLIDKT